MNTEIFSLIELKLSLQRALLGAITANLHSVTGGMKNSTVTINAYFYGAVSENDLEEMQAVTGEVAADLPENIRIEEACFSLQNTSAQMLDFWAFMRAP